MSAAPPEDVGQVRIPLDDVVVRFQLESLGAQGRIVRLGAVLDQILSAHSYPEPVARLLGEALGLVAMLGVALKTDGSISVQTNGSGPVSMLIASFRPPGLIRGYAMLDRDAYDRLALAPGEEAFSALLGKGHLAITVDPGAGMKRYQGIVALDSGSFEAAAHDYFAQSEQIATQFVLSVGRAYAPGEGMETGSETWRAGGLMLQHLAAEGGLVDAEELEARRAARGIVRTADGEDLEEAWARARLLLDTVESHELLDPGLAPERLLFRLFHEEGVRVFEPVTLARDCRCTPERIQSILGSYSAEDLGDMIEDGIVKVTCAFCNKIFEVDPDALRS